MDWQETLQDLCTERQPNAKGLCVIFANKKGHRPNMPVLLGVEADLRNMKQTFDTLRFAVLWQVDCTAKQMMSLFRAVANFSGYPPSYKRLAIVFAGHGEENGTLCAHDEVISVNDVIDQFQPRNCHPRVGGIPKLFFIDACRGNRKMGLQVVERGATVVPSKVVPSCGNVLVAYSTMDGYKAHESNGGIWMTKLSQKLLQDKSIVDIIVEVNRTLIEEFHTSDDLRQCIQQPECNITINEHINLFRESKEEDQGETPCNDIPSSMTSRLTPQRVTSRPSGSDSCFRGNDCSHKNSGDVYQQQLDTFVREQRITNYKESSETCGSMHHTKIEGIIGGKAYSFDSDFMESEEESKEQVAMRVVNFIQHQRSECVTTTTLPTMDTRGSSPSATTSISDGNDRVENAPSNKDSPHKPYKQQLNEYCQRFNIKVERDFGMSNGGHTCSIKVRGHVFTSSKAHGKKKDAEDEAAMMALQWLQKQQPTTPVLRQPGVMRLKEYCDRYPEKQLSSDYKMSSPSPNGPFQCTLTVTSPSKEPITVTGDESKSIQEAKHSAADKFLQQFE